MTTIVTPGKPPHEGLSPLPGMRPTISPDLDRALKDFSHLQYRPSPLSWQREPGADRTERLFDALADAKLRIACVAMYQDAETRSRLFRQLDALLDPDEWDDADIPLLPASMDTFLKAMPSLAPGRAPGLGLSGQGHLVAAWAKGEDRLTIVFLPEDRIRWVLARRVDGEIERVAGETSAARLVASLQGHHPEHWLADA